MRSHDQNQQRTPISRRRSTPGPCASPHRTTHDHKAATPRRSPDQQQSILKSLVARNCLQPETAKLLESYFDGHADMVLSLQLVQARLAHLRLPPGASDAFLGGFFQARLNLEK